MPHSKKDYYCDCVDHKSKQNNPKAVAARAAHSLNDQVSSDEGEGEIDQGDACDDLESSQANDEGISHDVAELPLPLPQPLSPQHLHRPTVEEIPDEDDTVHHQDEPPAFPHVDVPPPLDADEETLANDIYSNVTLNDLRISLAFIFGLANASLDDSESGLDAATVEHIRNPPQPQLSLDDDPDLKAAVKLYLKLLHAGKDYEAVREVLMESKDVDDFPTLYQAK
ncbi:uncharacterized protein F5147DRAFT_649686 [Suillus discolor]|uniref:Uncharacterized protein n=1 Tax=Suillus discolor TaxID=1912936 RepID=A0A9P7JY41_9AGAM|nr:uncharacterized protein F5147DRAFT_649686 [Suillus discolor]KAG2115309.1 hypothetical protein F5147DRAFT_649686 [Suillus discolor]